MCRGFSMRYDRVLLMWLVLLGIAASGLAQTPDGATVFQNVCATCHATGSDEQRAPALESLRLRSAVAVLNAMLVSGTMRVVTSRLTNAERRAVAEYVTGKKLDSDVTGATIGRCTAPAAASDALAGPRWSGWGVTSANARFQPADQAGLSAEQVPLLHLKWALGFPDTAQAWSQPAVAAGRVFVGSQAGIVYALDAKSGCMIWTFTAASGVRTGIVIDRPRSANGTAGYALYFSDMAGNVYAVNGENGQLL